MLFRFRYDFTFYDHDHESLYFRYKNSDELVMIIISDGACSDEKSQRWLQQTKKRIHQEQNCAVQQGELVAGINNETWDEHPCNSSSECNDDADAVDEVSKHERKSHTVFMMNFTIHSRKINFNKHYYCY